MAIVAATAIAGAAINASSAIIGNMQRNSLAMRQAKQYGRQQIALETNTFLQQEGLNQQAAILQQTTQQQQLQIEQNAMANQASSEVAAAVAGTEGQSVDLSITEIEASAGRAQGDIAQREINALNAIDQASRDIALDAETQRLDIELPDTRGQLLNVFASGLQGFLGSR